MLIPLWSGRPPLAIDDCDAAPPHVEVFLAAPALATGAAMLIYPGGAYSFLSAKSGAAYGRFLADWGITAFVVQFRLGEHGYRYQAILADAQRALTLVRLRAAEWGVDPARVGVIGTSAGGHLASLLLTHAGFTDLGSLALSDVDIAIRPALGVLCYPVIEMTAPLAHTESRRQFLGEQQHDICLQERLSANRHVTAQTPPCFIWHTLEDQEVSADNSKRFAEALWRNGVPCELHLYEKGAHALGLAHAEGLHWASDCIRWLRSHGF